MFGIFKVLALLGIIWYSDGAYLSKLGDLTPCLAPCTDYGVVITTRDNSSRLTLSVYRFNRIKGKMLKPSDVTKIETSPEYVSIDLDGILKGKKSIATAMMPLVTAAKNAVPIDYQLSTPILFSVDEETQTINEDAWFRILGDITVFYANKTVPFLTGPYSVLESEDTEDASYRWHAMNFIQGNFLEKDKKTVATLSFSGKMVSEIAYEISKIDRTVSYLSTIAKVPHSIVTSTYFRRGSLFALNKYFEIISNPAQPTIKSPCGPKGLKKEFKGKSGIKWILGTGEIMNCRNIIREKLFDMCNEMNGCAYLKHKIKGEIYGMPNVVKTFKQLGYKEYAKDFTPLMLDATIRKACGSGDSQPAPTVTPPTTSIKVPSSTPRTNTKLPTITIPTVKAVKIPTVNTTIKLPLKIGGSDKPIKSKGLFAGNSSTKRKIASRKNSAFEKRSIKSHTGITDCVNGNFLYLMLTEAYYLAPDAKIHVNNDDLPMEPDASLGELLVRMQLL